MPHSNKMTEKELFELYSQHHSLKVRDKIFNEYSYIAEICTRKFIGLGLEQEDIYQIACIGLLNAIERFDVHSGNKFSTFATPTVTGEIKRYFRDKGNFIKLPRKLYEIFYTATKIKKASRSAEDTTADVLAKELKVTPEEINAALIAGNATYIKSLDQALFGKEDTTLAYILGKEDDSFLSIENADFISKCMQQLSDEEQKLVTMRYYDEMSQQAIADELGVSKMYVSRLERKVLQKLKVMYFKY